MVGARLRLLLLLLVVQRAAVVRVVAAAPEAHAELAAVEPDVPELQPQRGDVPHLAITPTTLWAIVTCRGASCIPPRHSQCAWAQQALLGALWPCLEQRSAERARTCGGRMTRSAVFCCSGSCWKPLRAGAGLAISPADATSGSAADSCACSCAPKK